MRQRIGQVIFDDQENMTLPRVRTDNKDLDRLPPWFQCAGKRILACEELHVKLCSLVARSEHMTGTRYLALVDALRQQFARI